MRIKDLNRYYIVLLVAYLIALPLLIFFSLGRMNYHLSPQGIIWTLAIAIVSAVAFSLFAPLIGLGTVRLRRVALQDVLIVLLYASLIAIPEEILFRGFIQGFFQETFSPVFVSILLSSFIFAAAHLPNGAKGWGISTWNWDFFKLSFIGGLLFGSLYAFTGELIAPILLHILFLFGLRSFRTPLR